MGSAEAMNFFKWISLKFQIFKLNKELEALTKYNALAKKHLDLQDRHIELCKKYLLLSEKNIKIALDEEDFATLVRGGELTVEKKDAWTAKMILSDIGFHRMRERVEDAVDKKDLYLGRQRLDV